MKNSSCLPVHWLKAPPLGFFQVLSSGDCACRCKHLARNSPERRLRRCRPSAILSPWLAMPSGHPCTLHPSLCCGISRLLTIVSCKAVQCGVWYRCHGVGQMTRRNPGAATKRLRGRPRLNRTPSARPSLRVMAGRLACLRVQICHDPDCIGLTQVLGGS